MSTVTEIDGALVWRRGDEQLRIEAWGDDSLRVRAGIGEFPDTDENGALLPGGPASAVIARGESVSTITNGLLRASLDGRSGQLTFTRSDDDRELLSEAPGDYFWPAARV